MQKEAFNALWNDGTVYLEDAEDVLLLEAVAEKFFNAGVEWLRSQGEPVTYAVLDSFQRVVHTDSHAGCHEHINDAINQFEIYEAAKWIVRPIYLAPQPAIPDGWLERGKAALAECRAADDLWSDDRLLSHLFSAMTTAPEPKSC